MRYSVLERCITSVGSLGHMHPILVNKMRNAATQWSSSNQLYGPFWQTHSQCTVPSRSSGNNAPFLSSSRDRTTTNTMGEGSHRALQITLRNSPARVAPLHIFSEEPPQVTSQVCPSGQPILKFCIAIRSNFRCARELQSVHEYIAPAFDPALHKE